MIGEMLPLGFGTQDMAEQGSSTWYANIVMDALNKEIKVAGIEECDEKLFQGLTMVLSQLLRQGGREDAIVFLAPFAMVIKTDD